MTEIVRCDGCRHECDSAYRQTAARILLLKEEDIPASAEAHDMAQLLEFRLRTIANCTLKPHQIDQNLGGLMAGELEING